MAYIHAMHFKELNRTTSAIYFGPEHKNNIVLHDVDFNSNRCANLAAVNCILELVPAENEIHVYAYCDYMFTHAPDNVYRWESNNWRTTKENKPVQFRDRWKTYLRLLRSKNITAKFYLMQAHENDDEDDDRKLSKHELNMRIVENMTSVN